MTIRLTFMAGALGALAACQPAIPDSGLPGSPGRGVGFDTSPQAQAQLDAPLTVESQALPSSNAQNQAVQSGQPTPAQIALATPASQTVPAASTAQAQTQVAQTQVAQLPQQQSTTQGGLSTGPRTSVVGGREVLNASPSNPAPLAVNNASISDENDFGAVSSRQSIESDKARIASNRAQYAVVQPTALPSRTGNNQPNVVAYALQTKHPRGTQVHRRLGLSSAAKTSRNCAAYSSADEAQIDFLARGGPAKDRLALDPDGDGFACNWDPAKYRG